MLTIPLPGQSCFERDDFKNMEIPKVENPAGQIVAPFDKSSTRYEQWKRMDLSTIALETMPKQVDKNRVLIDLLKLHKDFAEDLSEET
jgi:hypothetical protein